MESWQRGTSSSSEGWWCQLRMAQDEAGWTVAEAKRQQRSVGRGRQNIKQRELQNERIGVSGGQRVYGRTNAVQEL